MSKRGMVPAVVGVLAALVLAGAALLAPLEVRHSAPFGFNLTFDARRGIAVPGGVIAVNYPGFDRLDLDLRAYDLSADYDLTVHVRPARVGAADVRTLPLSIPGARIRHDKGAFADPFVTLRFPPIADSAGKRYFVWIERGPRNRDDVVTLWSIKSYSRLTGGAVLAAFLRDPPIAAAPALVRGGLLALLLGLVGAFGWMMAAVTAVVMRTGPPAAPVPDVPARWAEGRPPAVASGVRSGAQPAPMRRGQPPTITEN